MRTLLAIALALFAALPAGAAEELTFRGEVVAVDLEGSLLTVKARKSDDWVEQLFEVDERTTEIVSRGSSETTPILLSDLELGDQLEVRYVVVKGRNVARLISRNDARHA